MVYLDEIRPWKTSWLIEAKVLHTWKPSNASFGESLEIVLSDKKGCKIHATCKKNYLKSLGEECKVGEWKTLYNFQVSAAGKHYRPTQHTYKITFINQTVIKPSDYQNDDMFLSLAEFDSVMSEKLDNDILIDIVGQAIEVSEIQSIQCGQKVKKKIEFQLRDIRLSNPNMFFFGIYDQRISCCLWGTFAEDMESHREEAQFGVLVCLIRFAKIGAFRGNLQISNSFDSSQLVFNPNINEAKELREAFKFNDDSMSIVETSEEGKDIVTQANNGTGQKLSCWKEYGDKNLAEILGCTQVEKCKVVATIYAIDTDYAWYYFGCNLCQTRTFKVLQEDINPSTQSRPLFWCEKCRQNVMNVTPRFKLHLIAKDDTAEAKFVLLDWIAWPVIGVKAEKILNGSLDEVEDPEQLPECITELVGKTFKFGVTLEKGSDSFKVLKVWSVYNTLMVDSQSETILEREATAISGSEVSPLTYSDESSSKMTTPSKRSVDDIVDIPDNTSTSKIRPLKSIKVEKMSMEELSKKKN
ncbi:hypothetical protein BRARA_C00144 [Brassica rapa]|uniref:DUF223 domain-containing protein n=1 Tax=Brassica campestris TaxID=3711 RepID=A0A397ZU41_BRACM|nr:hypothetical protein BRARA_C00144 [Brassica rapa]